MANLPVVELLPASRMIEKLAAVVHDERIRMMVSLGVLSRRDPKAKQLLWELWQGPVFARRLVLKSCQGSLDGDLVMAGLADSSRLVRGLAGKLVARCCTDEQATQALKSAFAAHRHLPLSLQLKRAKRTEPIDRFVDFLVAQGQSFYLCDVVPLGSEASARRHLHKALAQPSSAFFHRLVLCHPQLFAESAAVAMQKGPLTGPWKVAVSQELHTLAVKTPDAALWLIDALLSNGEAFPTTLFSVLAERRPGPLVDLCAKHKIKLPSGLYQHRANKLSPPHFRYLVAECRLALGNPRTFFRKLGAAEKEAVIQTFESSKLCEPSWGAGLLAALPRDSVVREPIYKAWSAASQNPDGVIPREVLWHLPKDLQEREARRHLVDVTALRTRPEQRILYATLLPWDEAAPHLKAYLGHPEGEMRGQALVALLGIPGRLPPEPALVEEALRICVGKKFEQDPVRLRMFQALAGWPKAVWDKKYLPQVGQLLRDALDAADLSHATAQAAERLLVRLFFLDGEFGGKWLATLLKERGTIYAPGLGNMLSDDEVRALAKPLLSVAESWSSREREAQLWALTQSLGHRIALVDGLPELLEKVMERTTQATVSFGILHLFYLHQRARFDRCVAQVVKVWVDKGWDAQLAYLIRAVDKIPASVEDSVEKALLRTTYPHQAELLLSAVKNAHSALLERLVPKALKTDRSFICVPTVWMYLHKRRQDLLTPYLAGEVVRGRFATGKTRWVLPFHDGFYRWSSEQQILFTHTLGGLYGDDDRDTPTILWAMERLCGLAYTSGESLIGLCDDKRPAVSERAVRTLSRLDAGQGVPKLLACLEDQRARFAIYGLRKALFEMPIAQAVAILKTVPLKKVTVAKEVVRLCGELRSDEAYKLLLSLDRPDLHRDIRIALCRALWDHLDRDESWQVLTQAATGPDFILATRVGDIPAQRLTQKTDAKLAQVLASVLLRPEPEARRELLLKAPSLPLHDQSRLFLSAILDRLDSRYYDEVEAAVQAVFLRALPTDVPAYAAQIDKTRKNRRALAVIVDQLGAKFDRKSQLMVSLGGETLRVLAKEAALSSLLLRAMVKLGQADELATLLVDLADQDRLSRESIAAAEAAVQALPGDDLEGLELRLAASRHPALRLLAVRALQAAAVKGQGFTDARRQRLRVYQQDPAVEVAAAAQLVFPPLSETENAS
ncbi:MAG TPA: hypothetical protein PKL17_20825 [Pseudomonadota bacterium]|nr:hypothetical protein [Pseudomonadota bacterium]